MSAAFSAREPAEGRAREVLRQDLAGRGIARDRGRVHPRGRARAGKRRPQRDHRRRVPPHLFPRRLPRAARRRRDPLRRVRRQVPQGRRQRGRLQAADHARRRQDPPRQADPGPRLRLPQERRDQDAEGLHSGAVDAAFPRRPARRSARASIPTSSRSTSTSPPPIATRSPIWRRAAAATCSSTTPISPISAIRRSARARAPAATIPTRSPGSTAGWSTTRSATGRRT